MIQLETLKCPNCKTKLQIDIYKEPLTKEEIYENKIGELHIVCSQLNDEKLNLLRKLEEEKQRTELYKKHLKKQLKNE